MSCVMCNFYFFFSFLSFGQRGAASRWRVCYQRGLPRWVLYVFNRPDVAGAVLQTALFEDDHLVSNMEYIYLALYLIYWSNILRDREALALSRETPLSISGAWWRLASLTKRIHLLCEAFGLSRRGQVCYVRDNTLLWEANRLRKISRGFVWNIFY